MAFAHAILGAMEGRPIRRVGWKTGRAVYRHDKDGWRSTTTDEPVSYWILSEIICEQDWLPLDGRRNEEYLGILTQPQKGDGSDGIF